MKYFRVWWKGKRIGAPYDVYSFKNYRIITDSVYTYVVSLKTDVIIHIRNEFIERIDFINERRD